VLLTEQITVLLQNTTGWLLPKMFTSPKNHAVCRPSHQRLRLSDGPFSSGVPTWFDGYSKYFHASYM